MSQIILWPGSASYSEVTSSTLFGFYNTDNLFISESVHSINWAGKKLGYPVMDVELSNSQFIACFEESVNEYGAQLNNFNIQENLLTLQGSSTSSNLQGREIRGGLGRIIRLTEYYGSEVGVGGDVDWKSGYINVVNGTQVYDLDTLWANVSESSAEIRIKRIFHNPIPASSRYYGTYGYTGDTLQLTQEFGFNSVTSGDSSSFILRPLYEDLLRMQSIELNDQIRKSAYSFELINNKLRIFPKPTSDFKLWFQYVIKSQADSGFVTGSNGTGVITDPSNVPYNEIVYTNLNSSSRQWIRNYFYALCKETLGNIRGKYQSVPIPNSEVTLDGDSLRTSAQTEKENLITQLKEMFDKMSRKNQLESKKEEDQNIQEIINKIPLPIFIG